MKKVLSLILCVCILLSLALSVSGIASVEIKGLSVAKTSIQLDVGASSQLAVTFTPANTTQKLLSFSTSNANVAAIDAKGKILAVAAGKAVITVASQSKSSIKTTIDVTVNKKKPVVLRVEVYDRGNAGGTPPDNNYWTKWIQANYGDKNNVTVKFETSPRFDNNAKLQMWMAAGTAPDLCYTNEIDPVNNFKNNGGLADLNPALNQYGAQLKEFLGDYLLTKGIDSKTGIRFNLRAKKVIDANESSWIRKDWLDKLGLPLPKTTAEWYNDMKAFKAQNPDKMGKVVPFAITNDVGWLAANLLEAYKTDKTDLTRYITNGRYLMIFAPGVKEGIKFMNKMYNEELISKEFPLDTQGNIWTADFVSGYAGFMTHNYDYPLRAPSPGILVNLQAKRPDALLVPCDPFTDKDGLTTKKLSDVAGIQMFVPKASESKAGEVVKYLNWMTDPDVLFFLQYGEKDKNHTLNNGIPQLIAAKGETIMNSPNNIDYTMIVNGVMGKTKDDTILRNSLAYSGATQQLYVDGWKLGIVNGYVSPEATMNDSTDADGKYGSAMQVKANEVYARTITCKPEEFESVWNSQTQAMLKAGASQIMAERKALWKKTHPGK
jgi:putative aldouronate transport system substrate-binding protein